MTNTGLSAAELLDYIPQQKPFRFIDEIISVAEDKILGSYTFKKDETFYPGHFPGNPVTPGVILLETMAQTGVVAYGIYLLSLQVAADNIHQWLTMFTDAQVEFIKPVYPQDTVIITAEKIFWRRMKLKSKVEMHNAAGDLVSACVISGLGVRKQ